MRLKNKTRLSSVLVFLFGVMLFFIGTDGFQAFTAETARVNQLVAQQPTFPGVTLEDSKARKYPFSEFKGKHVFITFFYTACGTVCPELERNMAQVYERLPKEYIGSEIQFLSISFDPDRDKPETLDLYRTMFNSDGETWVMARIPDKKELQSVIEELGVIVIPDGYGNFAHNSAFYLVNPEGNLVEIMDYTKPEEAAVKVRGILRAKGGGGR